MAKKFYKAMYIAKDGEIRSKVYLDLDVATEAMKKLKASGLPSLMSCGLCFSQFNGLNVLTGGKLVDLPSLPKEGKTLVNDVIADIVDPYITSMWCEYHEVMCGDVGSLYRVNITVDYVDGEREDRMILISKSGKSFFEF